MEQAATQMIQTVTQLQNGIIPVSTLYIGLNALIMLVLAILVVKARVQTKTEIGDGGNPDMIKAIRAHANNVEFVPVSLLVIAAVEMAAAPLWFVHVLGASLTLARVVHAIGLHQTTGPSAGRLIGTITNNTVLLAGGIACVYYGLN